MGSSKLPLWIVVIFSASIYAYPMTLYYKAGSNNEQVQFAPIIPNPTEFTYKFPAPSIDFMFRPVVSPALTHPPESRDPKSLDENDPFDPSEFKTEERSLLQIEEESEKEGTINDDHLTRKTSSIPSFPLSIQVPILRAKNKEYIVKTSQDSIKVILNISSISTIESLEDEESESTNAPFLTTVKKSSPIDDLVPESQIESTTFMVSEASNLNLIESNATESELAERGSKSKELGSAIEIETTTILSISTSTREEEEYEDTKSLQAPTSSTSSYDIETYASSFGNYYKGKISSRKALEKEEEMKVSNSTLRDSNVDEIDKPLLVKNGSGSKTNSTEDKIQLILNLLEKERCNLISKGDE